MIIGFIGVGTMGTPIVLNLLKKGFSVKIYARRSDTENVKKVVEKGGTLLKSLKEIGSNADVVMTCLPSPAASEEVILGENGVLKSMKKGSIIVELSTVPASLIRKIGEVAVHHGVEVLDAPISGGRKRAEEGTLTIMVGGKKEVFNKCLPIFQAIAQRIYHVGELGNGEKIKLINSLIANINLLVALEGLKIARKSAIDLLMLHEIIDNSTGQSWMWTNWIKSILKNESLGVKLEIMLKDLKLAFSMANEIGFEAKFCKLASEIIKESVEFFSGDADASILYQSSER
ncbi:MAG: NAD(P)-dependent oxidoreductase [Nitrososphaerota archaeon]